MVKKSFLSIGLVGIGNVFNAVLGFAFITAIARHLSLEEFGKYALLTSLLVSLSKLLDFGTSSLFVAKSIASEKQSSTSQFFGVKIILLLLSLPISLLVLVAMGFFSLEYIIIFSLGMLFYAISYTLFALFQKLERYFELVLLNTIPALIKGTFALLLFFNIVQMNVTQMFSVFSLSIGAGVLLYFFLPSQMKILNFKFSQTKSFLKEAFSPGLAQLITESFSAISNTIAKITNNFTSVGIFSIADKISSVFVLASFSIFTVLLPKNARRKITKEGYDLKETKLLAVGILALAVIAIFAAKILIPWIFDNKYNESLPIFNILVFAGAIAAIHTFMENYFFVEGKTKYLAYIYLTKLSILLLFSAILVPFYSIAGLAWSQLISATSALGIIYLLIQRG